MYPRTVLVVEDELLIRMMLADALEEEGYRVLEASNVLEAVALFARNDVDAIVTDVDMPGGLSGYDLVDMVAGLKALPIIVTSGAHRPDERPLPQDGYFLSKPYRLDDVCDFLALSFQHTNLDTPMTGLAS
jgi:two-component system, response regulator PdtaR